MGKAPTQVARREDSHQVQTTEAIEADRRPWWRRLRAAAGLSVLVLTLGVSAAAMLGLGALAVAALIDRALG
jgi:hypothetical protein